MQRLRNELANALAKLDGVKVTHALERERFQAQIQALEADISRERAENDEIIFKMSKLICPVPPL